MIRTVFFDFYNTLYAAHEWFELEVRELPLRVLRGLSGDGYAYTHEQEAAVLKAYRAVRERVHDSGVEITAEAGLQLAFESAGLPVNQDLSVVIARLQREAYKPGAEEPGAVECVCALHAAGYKLGIISNALCADFLHWSLAGSGIAGCFEGVFGSVGVGYYKSSPRLYEAALKGLGTRPEEAVHVGDSYRFDVLGAKAAGLWTVWYSPTGDAPPGDAADVVIARLSELPAAIARLSQAGVIEMERMG